ncbi:hypothetical protein MNV49_006996 [Pseudohyphozyma bogoriensis]|nr:hypothetical protein MNV49_006996 [Pseudohyphozyma bogoriensis]
MTSKATENYRKTMMPLLERPGAIVRDATGSGGRQDNRKQRPFSKPYVDSLKARIKELEALVLSESSPSTSASSAGTVEASEPSPLSSDAQSPIPAVSGEGKLSMGGDGELRWYTETSGEWVNLSTERSSCPSISAKADLSFLPVELSMAVHSSLINLAFQWFLGTHRMVNRQAFISGLIAGTRTRDYSPFVHLGVLAIGARYMIDTPAFLCSDPNDPETRGNVFVEAAEKMVVDEIRDPKFSTVRGLLLLSLHLGGTERAHSGWLYSGLAMRLCEDFGLNIDPPFDAPIQPDVRASRTELLNDGFAWPYEARLECIGARILQTIYSPVGRTKIEGRLEAAKRLWEDLQKWYEELPPALKADQPAAQTPEGYDMLVNHLMLQILLFRPFYGTSTDPCFHELATTTCLSAATQLAELVRKYQAGTGHQFCCGNTFHGILHGGTMSLLAASTASTSDAFSKRYEEATICLEALKSHALSWSTTKVCVKALESLREAVLLDYEAKRHVAVPQLGAENEPVGAIRSGEGTNGDLVTDYGFLMEKFGSVWETSETFWPLLPEDTWLSAENTTFIPTW